MGYLGEQLLMDVSAVLEMGVDKDKHLQVEFPDACQKSLDADAFPLKVSATISA